MRLPTTTVKKSSRNSSILNPQKSPKTAHFLSQMSSWQK